MKRNIFLSLLSAAFLTLPFSFPNLWILSWIGLIPFFWAIEGQSRKKAFWLSGFTGIVFWFGTIYWLIHVSLVGLIVLVLYLSLFFTLFGILTNMLLKKYKSINFIFIPALWVCLEYLRAYLFTGFGWALLGYSQYLNLPIIQMADITGAFGVSFLIVMSSVIFYQIFKKQNYRIAALVFIIWLSLSLFYGFNRLKSPLEGEKIKISVIQGNIPQEEKWDNKLQRSILQKYKTLTKQSNGYSSDLIIWPETSVPGYFLEEQWLYDGVTVLAKEVNTALLVGAPIFDRDSGKSFNSAILISDQGKIIQKHHKLHLVPFGEFVPFGQFLSFIRNSIAIGDFISGQEYTLFSIKNNLKFGVLICFEDVFPGIVRKFVRNGANFMVNITNDAWFKKTSAPYQHLQASVFRAVENRINVVRSANTGYSGFIDPCGRIINRVHQQKEEIAVAGFAVQGLTVSSTATFYNRFGDIFAIFCLFLSAISFGKILLDKK